MGFMDKVKSAAQDAATQAKTATGQAQAKMEQAQLTKQLNERAQQLGHLIYAERTQGTPAGPDADRLVSEMTELKAKIVAEGAPAAQPEPGAAPTAPAAPTDAATPAAPASPGVSTHAAEPTSGDFKL